MTQSLPVNAPLPVTVFDDAVVSTVLQHLVRREAETGALAQWVACLRAAAAQPPAPVPASASATSASHRDGGHAAESPAART